VGVFLDTGFILAFKNVDDKNHDIAQNWMMRFLKNEFGEIYTSTYVFDELVTLALVRLRNEEFAKNIGEYLLNSIRIQIINLDQKNFLNSWDLFQKYIKKGLSFTDCTILTLSTRLKCNIVATFDKHFEGLIGTLNDPHLKEWDSKVKNR